MAKHIWSVLCERVLQDHETQQFTLLNVTDSVTLAPISQPPQGAVGVQLDLLIVSHWLRDGDDARACARIDVHPPSGNVSQGRELEVDLSDERSYTVSRVEMLPFNGSGSYEFVVHCQRSGEWVECARVPLLLKHEQPPVPSLVPASE